MTQRRTRWVPAVLLVALVSGQLVVKGHLRDARLVRDDATKALGDVFSLQEQIVASLFGGLRAVLLNVLWIRIIAHWEQGQFLELPVLLRTVEGVQGPFSPYLYQMKAHMMCLDIPVSLEDDPETRWEWIIGGLEALERGVARFPENAQLLTYAGYVYFFRFDPLRFPRDRTRYVVEGRGDPLLRALELLEKALDNPDHDLRADFSLTGALRRRTDLLLEAVGEDYGDPVVASRARERLTDPMVRQEASELLDRGDKVLDHIEEVHIPKLTNSLAAEDHQQTIVEIRADRQRFRSRFLPPR